MPKAATKRKPQPEIIPAKDNVVEFPRKRGSTIMVAPDGMPDDALGTLTIGFGDDYSRYGLFQKDIVFVDKTLVPKMGDLCVILTQDCEVKLSRYYEMEQGQKMRGVVFAFQRPFER